MKLIDRSLTLLVFINAVYSAAMREGGQDLLHFLNDAFEITQPPDYLEPTKLSDTEKILEPAGPTAECKAPEIIGNFAEVSKTTPKPNSVEITGIAEERSTESSNSDSRLADRTSAEDSREVERYNRSRLRTTLMETSKALRERYENSAESMSTDRTDMDTEVTEDSKEAEMDVSSQEMDRPEENGRYRNQKMIGKYSAEMTGAPDTEKYQQESNKRAVDLDSPEVMDNPDRKDLDADSEEHSAGLRAKLNYAANHATLNDSREIIDQNPGCIETSVEHPMEENNSLDVRNVDQEIQKDTMSYQNQLRKICPSRRVRVSNNPKGQLDFDSPERVNSELLDKDNSGERLEGHASVTL
ncbi:uncharacterized protein zgc:194210 isoform X2 [Myxocyprinus asiaticus]|uniref:uncharacterized protein zgc:194210 isoform X2 n=1 Tax=Myxocyprinus asiaticus TaxID=70543 RepID=UPI00222308B1|nr:uncharacterized protein zgc:194210 isoform X2 [Myxocyprinus asiaticus]